eukprot:Awhi_evm1s13580
MALLSSVKRNLTLHYKKAGDIDNNNFNNCRNGTDDDSLFYYELFEAMIVDEDDETDDKLVNTNNELDQSTNSHTNDHHIVYVDAVIVYLKLEAVDSNGLDNEDTEYERVIDNTIPKMKNSGDNEDDDDNDIYLSTVRL